MSASESKKKCPYCAEMINKEAIKCRHCGSWLEGKKFPGEWTRSQKYGKILGVSAGLAKRSGISVTFIRLAFVLSTLVGGYGIPVYIVLALIMPKELEE
jgi:phage shock protein PspC (stress-responsive transcriptional regulator)